jgi:oleate hydratase
MCPADAGGPGGHCYVGCVPTTMGQICNYYRFPQTGTGSYSYECPPYGELTANFENTNYNWYEMPSSVSKNSLSTAQILYHLGVVESEMKDYIDESIVIPAMMPYITSQFMPRVSGDRPDVVPEGSTNLAFLGQFAEIKDDCVFTVEYSVRSAIMAVYTLLKLDKKVPDIYPSQYDIRVVAAATKAMYSGRPLPAEGIVKKLLQNTTLEGLI